MKLLSALHFNYVVVFMLALASLHSCIVSGMEEGSSSSGPPPPPRFRRGRGARPSSQPPSQPPSPLQLHPQSQPPSQPGSPFQLHPQSQPPQYKSIRSILRDINVNRIAQMQFTPVKSRYGDEGPYATVPIFRKYPVFSTNTDVQRVEQALLDYKGAYVVNLDPARPDARVLSYDPVTNALYHALLDEEPEATRVNFADLVRLLQAPTEVHVITKSVQRLPGTGLAGTELPPVHEVHDILHFQGAPVLKPSAQVTRGHMIRAGRMYSNGFWYIGANPVRIEPEMDAYVRSVPDNQLRALQAKIRLYEREEHGYGHNLASLLYGAPIRVDSAFQDLRRRPVTLDNYVRYSSNAARHVMVNALQTRGRFRYYDQRPGRRGVYRVRLDNPDAPHYSEARISVKPLSWKKLLEEAWLKLRGNFHILA